MDRGFARRLAALAVAYAVTLNALLPVLAAMTLPAAGAPAFAVICGSATAGAGSDRDLPAKQPLCPVGASCAMPGCAEAVVPVGGSAATGVLMTAHAPVGVRSARDRRQALRLAGPQQARAPPVA